MVHLFDLKVQEQIIFVHLASSMGDVCIGLYFGGSVDSYQNNHDSQDIMMVGEVECTREDEKIKGKSHSHTPFRLPLPLSVTDRPYSLYNTQEESQFSSLCFPYTSICSLKTFPVGIKELVNLILVEYMWSYFIVF